MMLVMIRIKAIRAAVPLILSALLAAGCDQTVKRTLPSDVRTVAVAEFANKTTEPLLSSVLHEELRMAFRMDGRVGIKDGNEGADGLLDGAVVEYTKQPARFDSNNVVQEYRLRVVVDLSLTDLRNNKVLWQEKGPASTASRGGSLRKMERYANFVVVPANGLPVETEQDAQRRMLRDLAADITARVIEGW
jgi:hypothetical protein